MLLSASIAHSRLILRFLKLYQCELNNVCELNAHIPFLTNLLRKDFYLLFLVYCSFVELSKRPVKKCAQNFPQCIIKSSSVMIYGLKWIMSKDSLP